MTSLLRKTTQYLAPAQHAPTRPGHYDIYPGFPVGPGRIELGFDALAAALVPHATVVLDGYGGVLWDQFRTSLDAALRERGLEPRWIDITEWMRSSGEIEALAAPFLGGDDPVFGTRFTGTLSDFFDAGRLAALRPNPSLQMNILYGPGAALAGWEGLLVYVDAPKNEIQFRSRAGSVTNLGVAEPDDPKRMYKRFYFVDWPALNRHKQALLPRIDLIVDEQRPGQPAAMRGDALRAALTQMAHNYFRVRPWFEPGPWGGQWIRQRIGGVNPDAPNYAWSFELIVPENGLMLESDGRLLEVSFDMLMYCDAEAVLGHGAARFGVEFPIRYDFLDTFSGGNLSVQCHPRPEYVREHFGEGFTQDEAYYILDAAPGARVYLGFREGVDPAEFRVALERSFDEGLPVEIDRFVNSLPSRPHDLFLIPSGTIHGSGVDNLVLEISATPYIFTFKMYDWLRLDLDGRPRPLNIARAFDNLIFERRGARVAEELVAHPVVLAEGPGWRQEHLPTHPEHFYDVHRYTFEDAVQVETGDSPNVLSLVQGTSIELATARGMTRRFNYIETFVVPAASGRYTLTNLGHGPATVVVTFLKRQ
jgi:mannose-6-phosphate isomerase class I